MRTAFSIDIFHHFLSLHHSSPPILTLTISHPHYYLPHSPFSLSPTHPHPSFPHPPPPPSLPHPHTLSPTRPALLSPSSLPHSPLLPPQVYQVAYVIVKSAVSPRPGNWILERSLDGRRFEPWQYYALSDAECLAFYGVQPTRGRPSYATDTQVICTSYFSRLNPLEGGEVRRGRGNTLLAWPDALFFYLDLFFLFLL